MYVASLSVIDALLCMDRLLDALSQCIIAAAAPVPDPAQSLLFLLPSVVIFSDMLEPMLELVTNTTPTAQQAGGSSDRLKSSAGTVGHTTDSNCLHIAYYFCLP